MTVFHQDLLKLSLYLYYIMNYALCSDIFTLFSYWYVILFENDMCSMIIGRFIAYVKSHSALTCEWIFNGFASI